ncbi:hypothetical protein AN219_02505, partial [Streptomyces nanshensis]
MDNASITDVWDRVVGGQQPPEEWLVLVTGLVALLAVAP